MRCFIALPLPEEAKLALAAVAAELSRRWPRCSWTRSEGYHATLAFLGEIESRDVDCAAAAVAGFAAGAIEFRFAGLGGFPPPGPWRVLYVGLDDLQGEQRGLRGSGGEFAAVHRSLNEALRAKERECGLSPLNPEWGAAAGGRGRPFVPHITLARCPERGGRGGGPARDGTSEPSRPDPRSLAAAAPNVEAALAGRWTIDRCVLYKSELGRGGSVYTELCRASLGAAAAEG